MEDELSLFSAMESYVRRETARFHMPGHKGRLEYFADAAKYDLTELDGLDALYTPNGCIQAVETKLAKIFGSRASAISTGGATLCIQAMLAAALTPGDRLVSARGCHAAAVNAMALLELEPVWVFPEEEDGTGLAKAVTACEISRAIAKNPDVKAVYITTPDYYGAMCDITAIAAVCREHGLPLLVDNAHGAHLAFTRPSLHPIALGASMCCDSLHKTLPVLTGGAALHAAEEKYARNLKRCMALFGSTSPSYLIMASIDRALQLLNEDFSERISVTAATLGRLAALARERGFCVSAGNIEPLRLSLGFFTMGYGRGEFLAALRQSDIEPEMCDTAYCVLMASPFNSSGDFALLENFIMSLPKKPPVPAPKSLAYRPKKILELREAVFAVAEEVPLKKALNRVAAACLSPCPPGIPVAVPGELVDENLGRLLERYGISRLFVLK